MNAISRLITTATFAAAALGFSSARAATIDEARAEAEKTGKPIFAIAASANCAACRVLENRLANDSALVPLVAQFVPLKVDTDSSEWKTWSEKYEPPGNTIPMIFVIRADGEQLYSKSPAPEAQALFPLMTTMLEQAGVQLDEQQLARVAKGVASANKLIDAGAIDKAIANLTPCLSTGSYAAPAVEANKLAKRLTDDAGRAITAAEAKLASESERLAGAMELIEVNRLYAKLPELNRSLRETMKKHNRDAATRDAMKQAILLDRAKVLANKPASSKRAIAAYASIRQQFPKTEAAKVADEKIAELMAANAPASKTSGDKPDEPGDQPDESAAPDKK